ncbi:MAG TPA: hypothetical protein ENN29_01855, partial [Candidatus Hydrogenedentes bacterium]|nr:hypothetical protein [Candidatus Hydrogenedentota bacterium]
MGGFQYTEPATPSAYYFDDVRVYQESQFRLENVPSTPIMLLPGEFLTVDAVFAPVRRGPHQDIARVVTNNIYEPVVEVMLTGTGIGHRRHVKTDGDDDNDGLSWNTAKATLQAALEDAVPGDDIWVAAGIYYPTSLNGLHEDYGERGMHFRLKDDVYLFGGFVGNETALEQRDLTVNITRLSGDIGESGNPNDNCYHVIFNDFYSDYFEHGLRLDGFVISDGNADGWHDSGYYPERTRGGGLNGFYNSLTVVNCVFENNQAHRRGGGAAIQGYNNTIRDCVFADNFLMGKNDYYYASSSGGGLYLSGDGTTLRNCAFFGNYIGPHFIASAEGGGATISGKDISVSNCVFDDNYILLNYADSFNNVIGGGAAIGGERITITDCTFTNNRVQFEGSDEYQICGGGALVLGLESSLITNCRFSSNSATFPSGSYFCGGGAIFYFGTETSFSNCVFDGNYADTSWFGSAAILNTDLFYYQETNMNIINSTFYGNETSSGSGGAVSNVGSYVSATILNSILWNTGEEEIYNDGAYADVLYSNIQGGYDGEGNMDADPLFVNPAKGDLRLSSDSPCIDAGDPAGVPPAPEWDILGTPRPQYAGVDMGAYEYDNDAPTAAITLLSPVETGADVIQFYVTFSEPVLPGLTAAYLDVVGTLSGSVAVSGGGAEYYVTVTLDDPDADGAVGIALPADTVFDPAGNFCPGVASPLCEVFNWRGFLVEPAGARLYTGDSHALIVQPDCDASAIQYQWKYDDGVKALYDGPQTREWLLEDVATDWRGVYWCEVTYDGMLYATNPAQIEVEPPLEIVAAPESAVKYVGDSHLFAVEVAGGYPPLTYQWRKEDATLSNEPMLLIESLILEDSGLYVVVVQDDNSATLVLDAALTVLPLPVEGEEEEGEQPEGEPEGEGEGEGEGE